MVVFVVIVDVDVPLIQAVVLMYCCGWYGVVGVVVVVDVDVPLMEVVVLMYCCGWY